MSKSNLQLTLWLVFAVFLHTSFGTSEIHTLYMNSYKMCGDKANYDVTKDVVYRVKADVSPETATNVFKSCEMTFNAEETQGRLCLVQDYPRMKFAAKNAKLVAADGLDINHNQIFSIGYAGHWDFTEKCTKSRYITLYMSNSNQDMPVDITDITLNLRVMNIGSGSRRIDMAYDSCEKTFDLYHSEINVYNRQSPEDVKGREAIGLKRRCQVTVKRLSASDRNICIVYIPQGKPDCSSGWTFYVLKERNSFAEDNILYKIDCKNDLNALQTHAWCAPNTTNQVTLLHRRTTKELVWSNNTKLEQPETYRILVSDFPGGNVRELLRKTEAQLAAQSGSDSAGFSMWWVLLAVGVGLLVIIAGFAYFSRRRRCGRGGRKKRSRDSEATDRESSIANRDGEEEEEEDEE
ncbi:hypothetical protein ElyMa_002036200 [Elysia marginata]|uniref:Uncharacterized protein n=1 Tax=Elysia marginata TaxID=1093978 RepID=A0AAV4F6X9_9GAST|nr:hypothetical protein ElyMa_002036200 [Elysia marginata]